MARIKRSPSLHGRFFKWFMRWRAPSLSHGTSIADIRRGLDAAAARSTPPEGTTKRDMQVAGMQARWITPAGKPNGIMLYLHGGAYVAGSITSHSNIVAYFADKAGVEALVVEYRLAPEHPFPAASDDALNAYGWLLGHGYDADQIVIAGDSAGGGLTLSTLVRLRDEGRPLPAAAVCLSPWTDLAGTGESLHTRAKDDPWLDPESIVPGAAMYHGDAPPTHPLVSPLYADLSGLPPILIQVGDHEILLSDSVRIAEKIRECGGSVQLEIWPGMWHVFQSFTHRMPESRQAADHIARFVRKHLS